GIRDFHVTGVQTCALPISRGAALVLELDLGPELGPRTSSARLGADYDPAALVGTQVVVVANLPPRRVAGVDSEVLVLAAVDPEGSEERRGGNAGRTWCAQE